MAFDLSTTLGFTIKDGTVTIGYLTDGVIDEDQDEASAGAMKLANGATDVTIPLGGLTTVKAIALKSDFQLTIKINGSIAIACKAYYMRDCAITTLTASNASGSAAVLQYVMAGV